MWLADCSDDLENVGPMIETFVQGHGRETAGSVKDFGFEAYLERIRRSPLLVFLQQFGEGESLSANESRQGANLFASPS